MIVQLNESIVDRIDLLLQHFIRTIRLVFSALATVKEFNLCHQLEHFALGLVTLEGHLQLLSVVRKNDAVLLRKADRMARVEEVPLRPVDHHMLVVGIRSLKADTVRLVVVDL